MKTQQGFTLTELLVTLIIIAILATLAVPSFREAMLQGQKKSIAKDIYATVQYAKSEALKGNMPIFVLLFDNRVVVTKDLSDLTNNLKEIPVSSDLQITTTFIDNLFYINPLGGVVSQTGEFKISKQGEDLNPILVTINKIGIPTLK